MDAILAKRDPLVAQIAGRQHGVIRIDQLDWAGLSRTQVRRRVQAGHLHRLYRGVYAVGHTHLSDKGRVISAVFAYGEGAVASHESAAYVWSYSPTCPPLVHVTVTGMAGRAKRKGIVLHYSTTLSPKDTTSRHNIPVTSPDRTRRDLGWDREPTRSHLERDFLRLLRSHELPLPEVNVRIGPYEVDFLWRAERLVAELDGYAHHSSRASFERDRRRDRDLQRRGYTVLRFTYREVAEEQEAVATSLIALLRQRRRTAA